VCAGALEANASSGSLGGKSCPCVAVLTVQGNLHLFEASAVDVNGFVDSRVDDGWVPVGNGSFGWCRPPSASPAEADGSDVDVDGALWAKHLKKFVDGDKKAVAAMRPEVTLHLPLCDIAMLDKLHMSVRNKAPKASVFSSKVRVV